MLKAFGDNILVRRSETKEVTDGGIYVPDTAKEKPAEGTVISVGDSEHIALLDKIVLFGQYAGVEAGDNLLIIRSKDILAIKED